MSDWHGVKNFPPLRRELDDVLQQNTLKTNIRDAGNGRSNEREQQGNRRIKTVHSAYRTISSNESKSALGRSASGKT